MRHTGTKRESPTETTTGVFCDEYLDERLIGDIAWGDPANEELRRRADELVAAWDELGELGKLGELGELGELDELDERARSERRAEFVRTVCRVLGIPCDGGTGTVTVDSDGVGIADVRPWGRPLDGRVADDGSETNGDGRNAEHPAYRLSVALRETSARWGLLTNGRQWRLYSARTCHRLDSTYEIDLPRVLEERDSDAFCRFYRLFGRDAFVENASGECLLDELHDGSRALVRNRCEQMSGNLRDALLILAEGFFEHAENDLRGETLVDARLLSPDSETVARDRLDLVFDGALVYLYRLLALRFAVSEEEWERVVVGDDGPRLDRLNEPFRRVGGCGSAADASAEPNSAPAFSSTAPDGYRFRPTPGETDGPETRFLSRYRVDDDRLAAVIDLLTYRLGTDGRWKRIEYDAFDGRHLGALYERLLECQLDRDSTGELTLTSDAEGRNATGTFYTPESVVEHVVETTLGPLVSKITAKIGDEAAGTEFAETVAERVLELNVLDPAMGCGNFLTSVVDYLAWELVGARERQAEQHGVGTLNPNRNIDWARRQVAAHCLHGVDVNSFAVELARLSLRLRTTEGAGTTVPLGDGFQVGNALVGNDGGETGMRWKRLFPGVFNGSDGSASDGRSGFDAVVGNPPYLKSQHIDANLDATLCREYETVEGGAYDCYVPFVELANRLRSATGRVGYVVPNRFFEANYGTALRRYLVEERCLSGIVDFGETQVFDGASTYTCLLFLAGEADALEYRAVSDVAAFVAGQFDGEVRTYDRAELGERWTFAAREPGRVIERLTDETTETLGDATDRIFKGFDTGLADFYRVRKVAENGNTLTVRSGLSEGAVEIEAELLVPLLKGKDLEPYAPAYRNRLLFFPYRTHETGHRLLDEAEIAESYPNAYRYLTAHESTLRARQDGAYDDAEWYRYTNPRNLHRYRTPKLCSPYNAFFPAFVDDDAGFFFTTGFSGGYGTIPSESADDFRGALTAILNSTLAQFFIERTSTPMRGNYFSYEKRFIEDVPLPLTAFSTGVETRERRAEEAVRAAESVVADGTDSATLLDSVASLLQTDDGLEPVYHVLDRLADASAELRRERRDVTPSLFDCLGTEFDGPPVDDHPAARRVADAESGVLSATTRTHEKLRLGTVRIEERPDATTVFATARYKPVPNTMTADPNQTTDRWGFTETDVLPAVEFAGLTDSERTLVADFIPDAVERSGGFAGFRPNATKTNSLVDRLGAIRLPDIDAVGDDLRRYTDRKRRAEVLTERLERATAAIDSIVYDCYGLTDEEIRIVESSLLNDRPL